MGLPPQSPEPQSVRLGMERAKRFGHRVDPLHCPCKTPEMVPEIVAVDIKFIPVPALAGTGTPGEKRRKKLVVQQRAFAIEFVKMGI